ESGGAVRAEGAVHGPGAGRWKECSLGSVLLVAVDEVLPGFAPQQDGGADGDGGSNQNDDLHTKTPFYKTRTGTAFHCREEKITPAPAAARRPPRWRRLRSGCPLRGTWGSWRCSRSGRWSRRPGRPPRCPG